MLSGYSEYEWTVTIAAVDVPKLAAALRVCGVFGWRRNGRLLHALRQRFSGGNASRLEPFLKDHDIPHALWNRVGD